MIIFQENLLECNRPVSQLLRGAAARRREKIYDVVILDPISGLRCNNRSIRVGTPGNGNMYGVTRVYKRAKFFASRGVLISADE